LCLETVLSLEGILLILLLGHVLLSLLIGLAKGREYLNGYATGEKEYRIHSVQVTLTFAGLAMTALALFISVRAENLTEIASILLFFSVSFSIGILSSVFARFPRNWFRYLADVLADTAILAIGCGFLAFCQETFQWSVGLSLVFISFIVVFLFLSLYNLYKYYKYWTTSTPAKRSIENNRREDVKRSTISLSIDRA